MMVTVVKHEWHSHDRQYAIEIDEDLLSEIYPDLDEDEIALMLQQIENGEIDVEEVIDEAYENDVDIDWQFQYDDCWTDRKGGYEVTYELGDDSSWHSDPEPPEPTHQCTKCKWKGQSYDAEWQWQDKDGNDLEDAKKVCPMCDSDLILTESGAKEEKERAERMAEIDAMLAEDESSDALSDTADTGDSEVVCPMKCTKCEWTGDWTDTKNDDDGFDICPNCGGDVEDVEKENK